MRTQLVNNHIYTLPKKVEMSNADGFQGKQMDRELAYTLLIKTYSKLLFDFGYRFCQDEDIVKDCLQQLYLDLWNRNFDISSDGNIKSYLFKAVKNRVLREKSKWNTNEQLDEEYDFLLEFGMEATLIADTQNRETALKFKNILNTLPPRQREIIYLKFYEDLDTSQISSIMGINRQSVHNLLQKAYGNIRTDWKVLMLFISVINLR